MPQTFTKDEQNAIDELAARFAEGSDDVMSLSYQIQSAIRNRLLTIENERTQVRKNREEAEALDR